MNWKRWLAVALVALALGAFSADAEARTDTVPCRTPAGAIDFRERPRNCTIGGRYGYQQVDIKRIRWRSWGGYSSYGRGINVANMGARARMRFVVYRSRRCEGAVYAYTRARSFTFGWTMRLRWRC